MNEGLIATNEGLHIPASAFESQFHEEQVPYSNALHCTHHGKSYFTGPLARLHLNHERLSPRIREALQGTGLSLPFKRASLGIVARALEVLLAVDEALRLIEEYEPPPYPSVPVSIRAGTGMAATEALVVFFTIAMRSMRMGRFRLRRSFHPPPKTSAASRTTLGNSSQIFCI